MAPPCISSWRAGRLPSPCAVSVLWDMLTALFSGTTPSRDAGEGGRLRAWLFHAPERGDFDTPYPFCTLSHEPVVQKDDNGVLERLTAARLPGVMRGMVCRRRDAVAMPETKNPHGGIFRLCR